MEKQSYAKRSRSTQRTDHNFLQQFSRHGSMGPSMLLKSNGKEGSYPKRGGDYHENLKSLHNYVKPSPQEYKLPELFDNIKEGKGVQMVKNPQTYQFGIKHSPSRVLQRDLLTDVRGMISPGVGKYHDIKDKTFDQIKSKFAEGITPRSRRTVSNFLQDQIGTFTMSDRFKDTPMQKLKQNYPAYYSGVNEKFGKLQQSKQMPSITEETQRQFEASNNRSYFGIPAKCEGPGPAQNHNES